MQIVKAILEKEWLPYVFPFAAFLLLTELGSWLGDGKYWLYPLKTLAVGYLLFIYRKSYVTDFSDRLSPGDRILGVFVGIVSLAIWVLPESYLPKFGSPSGFNPYMLSVTRGWAIALMAIRIFGAAVIVPIMEELFWRSFLLRYLVKHDFKKVSPGTYTPFSFFSVALLFGLEHHRFIVGIIVGLLYNYLMVRRKRLLLCILAHAVTNLGLGIYIIYTGNWSFW